MYAWYKRQLEENTVFSWNLVAPPAEKNKTFIAEEEGWLFPPLGTTRWQLSLSVSRRWSFCSISCEVWANEDVSPERMQVHKSILMMWSSVLSHIPFTLQDLWPFASLYVALFSVTLHITTGFGLRQIDALAAPGSSSPVRICLFHCIILIGCCGRTAPDWWFRLKWI